MESDKHKRRILVAVVVETKERKQSMVRTLQAEIKERGRVSSTKGAAVGIRTRTLSDQNQEEVRRI
jgi:hypothetical protein